MARLDRPKNYPATIEEPAPRRRGVFTARAVSGDSHFSMTWGISGRSAPKLLPALRRLSLRFEIIAVNDGSFSGGNLDREIFAGVLAG
jgi:hypothetical protein